MTDALPTLESRFWSKVWQCSHHHPCKKCCWPWKTVDVSVNLVCIWSQHALFYDATLAPSTTMPAHRFAYFTRVGTPLFGGSHFPVCHQCHFAPCCNPCHLAPGSPTDNAHDRKRIAHHTRIIVLPDGRVWDYADARLNHRALVDSLRAQSRSAVSLPPVPSTLPLPPPYVKSGESHPGERVLLLRNRLGLNAADLAKSAGIHLDTLRRVEHGDEVMPTTLEALATALKTTMEYLYRPIF